MVETLVRVDNRVRVFGVLPKIIEDELKASFEYDNPKFLELRRMGLPHWKEPRRLGTWKQEDDHLSFPRGRGGVVAKLLRQRGYDIRIEDKRVSGETVFRSVPTHNLAMRPHQITMSEAITSLEQLIIRCATGGGKTSAAISWVSTNNIPTMIVVHSTGLMEQWMERAERELGYKPKDIGIYQGSTRRLRPLTIGMQRTLSTKISEDQEARDYFGAVIADEVHLAAADTYYQAIDPFPAKYRVGMSDDHRRKDQKEFLIYDIFGDVGVSIPYQDLIDLGVVMDVEVRIVETEFKADWYGMPNDEDDKQIDFIRLVKEMALDEARMQLCMDIVLDEVRIGPSLVMTHERAHCGEIAARLEDRGIKVGMLLGGDQDEFEENKERLKRGDVQVGVGTYKSLSTGIDIPSVTSAIAYTPIAANEQLFKQARGRVCRTAEGKRGARFYVLWDKCVYPAHKTNLRRWNSRVFMRKSGQWAEA